MTSLPDDVTHEDSIKSKILDMICGGNSENIISQETYNEAEVLGRAAIQEDPKWKRIVNISAIVTMCIGAYVIGYFS